MQTLPCSLSWDTSIPTPFFGHQELFPRRTGTAISRLLFHVSALACTRGGSVGCVINTYGSITALKYFLQGFLRVGNCLCGLLYLPLVVFLRLPRATSHSPHGFDKLSRLNERERENRYVSPLCGNRKVGPVRLSCL